MLKEVLLLWVVVAVQGLRGARFSEESQLTLVTTSCGRMGLLKRTYESFFRNHHYALREIRIIDDCSTPEEEILACVPVAEEERGLVKVMVNEKHLGQFASIDRLYSGVRTKFVLHLEDDFYALPSSHLIERAIHVLEWAEASGEKVSQISFARQLAHHFFRSELLTTPSNIGYFIKHGTPQREYDFSLQPHIINYDAVYKKMLNSSMVNTIGPLCKQCLQKERLQNVRCVGCFEPQLGRFFQSRGWYSVILDDDRDDGGWTDIGHYGDHVSMSKIKQLLYYKIAIVCVFVIQMYRLVKQILLYPPPPSKTKIISQQVEQLSLK